MSGVAETYRQACNRKRAAETAVDGRPYLLVLSPIVTGNICRQVDRAADGGDPTVYDSEIRWAHRFVSDALIQRDGLSKAEADAVVRELEDATRAWLATPAPAGEE